MNFPQVFVLKDTWHNDQRNLEGDLYRKAGPGEGLAKFYCDGVVKLNGWPDNTTALVRQGMKPSSKPLRLTNPTKKLETNWETDWSSIPHSQPSLSQNPTSNLHGHTHSRTILATYGWPIYRFTSPLEIVQTLKSAVKGKMSLFTSSTGDHKLLSAQDTIICIRKRFFTGILVLLTS